MSYEVEIKAHVPEDAVQQVKETLSALQGCKVLGEVVKEDTYFAVHETDHQLFRVRLESIGDQQDVLVTAKPLRSYEGTEINKELEFHSIASEISIIKDFFTSLGYTVCLNKKKTGWACVVPVDGFDVIAELLKVNDIGYFLEIEITSIPSEHTDESDNLISKAQKALMVLLKMAGINEKAIEKKSYRKMILEEMAKK